MTFGQFHAGLTEDGAHGVDSEGGGLGVEAIAEDFERGVVVAPAAFVASPPDEKEGARGRPDDGAAAFGAVDQCGGGGEVEVVQVVLDALDDERLDEAFVEDGVVEVAGRETLDHLARRDTATGVVEDAGHGEEVTRGGLSDTGCGMFVAGVDADFGRRRGEEVGPPCERRWRPRWERCRK